MLESLLCAVIAVSDGDTLTASCGEYGQHEQVRIRLAEIDAPEKGQPFGQRSKQSLASLCFGARAVIRPEKLDRYGRTVARVQCRGTDASHYQVSAGMAWAFTRYLSDHNIRRAEDQAKVERRGLWWEPSPIPPWEYRIRKTGGGRAEDAEGAHR
jgi:endonuclease YncB( thermonuclease family)